MSNKSEGTDLTSVIKTILDEYENYNDIKNDISFDEYHNKILLPSLRNIITNSQFKNYLGESNVESLNKLLINIKEKFDVYTDKTDLGYNDDARKEKKEIMLVDIRIIQKLESILQSFLLKDEKLSQDFNNKSDKKSGSLLEELSLGEDQWRSLIGNIKMGQCVPFVDSGINSSDNPLSDVSEQWTELYDYPFEDSSQLSRVAQFIAIDKGDQMYPKKMLSKMLREIKPPDFSKVNDSPYLTLASLDLPIYITTSYDHILEEALLFKHKKPKSEVCRWFPGLKKHLDNAGKTSVFKTKYKPNGDEPLVYHLHGDMDIPQSMVLTERDYIQFVINISKEKEGDIFPSILSRKLALSSLLFIGYSLEEINFRIIFQCVLGLQEADLREASVSVQLPPRVNQTKQEKALKYLRQYIPDQKVYVYWGDSNSFCNDLSKRLR